MTFQTWINDRLLIDPTIKDNDKEKIIEGKSFGGKHKCKVIYRKEEKMFAFIADGNFQFKEDNTGHINKVLLKCKTDHQKRLTDLEENMSECKEGEYESLNKKYQQLKKDT